jgi:hypothetical protein
MIALLRSAQSKANDRFTVTGALKRKAPPTRRSSDQFNPLIVVRHRHVFEDIPKPSELCQVSGRNGGQFRQ